MGATTNNAFSKATAGQSGDNSGGYGVTQTNGKTQSVPQIDPTAALNYFAQSGKSAANGYQTGNAAYQAALQTAATQIQEGYFQANATLQPLSAASNQALTLYQQMLGITPASTTANFGSELTAINPALSSTAALIGQANSTVDPTQRAALQNQISQQITAAGNSGVSVAQAAINSLGSAPTDANYKMNEFMGGSAFAKGISGGGSSNFTTLPMTGNQTTTEALPGAQAEYNQKLQAAQQQLATAQQQQQQLNSFNNSFNNTFTPTAPQGFNAQEVAQHVESTPGYQFNLDQGNQQILRNQAAVSNLGTGNTQIALQNYGENYALNSYNSYMSNLQNLINNGTAATTQIAANQANQGGYLSNLSQLSGQATNAADVGAGNAIAQAQMQQGNTAYNAAALNTQLQMQAYSANQNAQNQAASNAMSLAGSSMNNQAVNESGAGFYQGMNAVTNAASNSLGSSRSNNVASNGGAI